jgi:formate dehydrogenase maturation protein FdhE
MDDNRDKEIMLHGIIDELYAMDKMDVLEFIENILGELSQKRLDNILSNLIEERINQN